MRVISRARGYQRSAAERQRETRLGKSRDTGRIRGTVTLGLCTLGVLSSAAAAHGQVRLPGVSLPETPVRALPSLPAPQPAPRLPAVEVPRVPLPEPVEQALPAPSPGGSGGGVVGGVTDTVRSTVDGVVGGVRSATEGGGPGAAVEQVVGGVRSAVGEAGSRLGGAAGGAAGGATGGAVGAARGASGAAVGAAGARGGAAGAGGGPAVAGKAAGAPHEAACDPRSAGGRACARRGAACARDVGRRACAGRGRLSSRAERRRAIRRRAAERRRARLVRRLSGCLDVLPALQRTTLILRYGVGPVRSRTRGETARLLQLPRGRVRLVERRGLRALDHLGDSPSCAGTGLSGTALVAIHELLLGTSSLHGQTAAVEAGLRLAGAATLALDESGAGRGTVAGVRQSGGAPREDSIESGEDAPVSSGPALVGDLFGTVDSALNNPFLIALLAIVVACLASAGREIRRAIR